MVEANAYNQAKATIDSELSQAMQKFEEAKSKTATNKKRLQQIETRIPELKEEIGKFLEEKNSSEFDSVDLEELFKKIDVKKEKIDEELKLLDSDLRQVLSQQSQAASKKHDVDLKIKNNDIGKNKTVSVFEKIEAMYARGESGHFL